MVKGQSRLGSITEAVLNVGSGFLLSMGVWQLLAEPLWGYEARIGTTIQITTLFTVTSVIRGYMWRRFFEGRIPR